MPSVIALASLSVLSARGRCCFKAGLAGDIRGSQRFFFDFKKDFGRADGSCWGSLRICIDSLSD